jgi:hypothetical protein
VRPIINIFNILDSIAIFLDYYQKFYISTPKGIWANSEKSSEK